MFLIDTGAESTFLSIAMVHALGLKKTDRGQTVGKKIGGGTVSGFVTELDFYFEGEDGCKAVLPRVETFCVTTPPASGVIPNIIGMNLLSELSRFELRL